MTAIAKKEGFADLASFRASLKTNPKYIPTSSTTFGGTSRKWSQSCRSCLPCCRSRPLRLKLFRRGRYRSEPRRVLSGCYHVPMRSTAPVVRRNVFLGWIIPTSSIHVWEYWKSTTRQANGLVITTSTPPPSPREGPL